MGRKPRQREVGAERSKAMDIRDDRSSRFEEGGLVEVVEDALARAVEAGLTAARVEMLAKGKVKPESTTSKEVQDASELRSSVDARARRHTPFPLKQRWLLQSSQRRASSEHVRAGDEEELLRSRTLRPPRFEAPQEQRRCDRASDRARSDSAASNARCLEEAPD